MKLFLSLAVAALLACPPAAGENENFMQGTWRLSGTSDATHGWFLEWTFDRGSFTLEGYPPLRQEGKYRVLSDQGNKLSLELYDQQGNFGTDNSQLEIVVDKEQEALKIKDRGPFKRFSKS